MACDLDSDVALILVDTEGIQGFVDPTIKHDSHEGLGCNCTSIRTSDRCLPGLGGTVLSQNGSGPQGMTNQYGHDLHRKERLEMHYTRVWE